MDNDSQKHDDNTFSDDDDLFNGLTEEDYDIDETSIADDELDDDLSSGYVHESVDDEQLYNYQDESGDVDAEVSGAYAVQAGSNAGVIERFKLTLKEGSLSDKIRSLLVPLLFGGLILGFCVYKIAQILSPPTVVPTAQQGLDVRNYIERPKPPSKKLQSKQSAQTSKSAPPTASKVSEASDQASIPGVSQSQQAMPTGATDDASQSADTSQSLLNEVESMQPLTQSAQTQQNDTDMVLPFMQDETDSGVASSTTSSAAVVSKTADTTVIQTQLTQAQATLTQLGQQQQQNSQQITQLQQQINAINTQFTTLNNTLAKTLKELQTQIAALRKARITQQKVAALNKKARSEYTIQAIIPGRAWLKTQQGKIITVTRGNTVPGYGTVTDIDVENGVVRTRSGAVFSYALGQ